MPVVRVQSISGTSERTFVDHLSRLPAVHSVHYLGESVGFYPARGISFCSMFDPLSPFFLDIIFTFDYVL